MKILLAAVNAKYIHSNYAVYCLKAYAEKYLEADRPEIEIAEYTVNQQTDDIMRDIYERKPDVLCFSCYIWNLEIEEQLADTICKVRGDMPVWMGGPEVSYDPEDVLVRLPFVKGVMKGEGEDTFLELCRAYRDHRTSDKDLEMVAGITFRGGDGKVISNPWRAPVELSRIPFVYSNLDVFTHRILYYETSRGCPFSCSYCLSSIPYWTESRSTCRGRDLRDGRKGTDRRVRFRDLEMVKEELQFFLDQKVPQVKFVDRTFNCSHGHALAIWKYIAEHDNGVSNFHFEVSADLFREEELDVIQRMRPGLIQLEIGVQSTNPDTIREIRRTMDLGRVRDIVLRIGRMGNVHQHLDLIAGLPFEDLRSFARSFDEVYSMAPHQLQLGFLKVLKGSYMETQKESYRLVHKSAPPYEVLSTRWLSYDNILCLKGVEEMVETYYNSRQFEHTLEELLTEYDSAFAMYEELWKFYKTHGLHNIQHKRSARYDILFDFVRGKRPDRTEYYRELLIYDYYLRENARTRPEFAGEARTDRESVRRFYEKEEAKRRYLPGYGKYDKNQMRKMTHLEVFEELGKTVLFDYMERNPLNQEARTVAVTLEASGK